MSFFSAYATRWTSYDIQNHADLVHTTITGAMIDGVQHEYQSTRAESAHIGCHHAGFDPAGESVHQVNDDQKYAPAPQTT